MYTFILNSFIYLFIYFLLYSFRLFFNYFFLLFLSPHWKYCFVSNFRCTFVNDRSLRRLGWIPLALVWPWLQCYCATTLCYHEKIATSHSCCPRISLLYIQNYSNTSPNLSLLSSSLLSNIKSSQFGWRKSQRQS